MPTLVASKLETGLRKDAERNRGLLLVAAREVFGERGIEASLEEIARRAGVGIGTLYRRFPSREDLIEALFESKIEEYVEASEAGLRAEDPWQGFCAYVSRICAMQAEDRGFTDVLTGTFPRVPRLEARRAAVRSNVEELIRRAQAAGGLRADFVFGDLVWVLMANGTYLQATRDIAPGAWKRYVALIVDGLRAERAGELPPPPNDRELEQAIRRVGPGGRVVRARRA
jgi:AcrR family transcriptional regulator